MNLLKYIKIICYLNFIFFVVIILFTTRKTKNNSSNSSIVNLSFRETLINEHLASYSRMYDNSINECNITNPLTDDQKRAFHNISKKLTSFRTKMIPYPNEYFHGRGIVLTVGLGQLKFAKVNLKMIEITGTRLPVQVIL